MDFKTQHSIHRAAIAIASAEILVITAGAGMGVDSGLPDFRGTEGFWRAYPPFAARGLRFEDVASPRWFREDPGLAWGFYGHRENLYRSTVPHEGFSILRRWVERLPDRSFVITSNVDAQFTTAGFDPECIWELHGSIMHRQCRLECGQPVYASDGEPIAIDPASFRAEGVQPVCPRCGSQARPNILMFGDDQWDSTRSDEQYHRLQAWAQSLPDPGSTSMTLIEIGAGEAIATIRRLSEAMIRRFQGTLIRINPRDAEVPHGQISLPLGALEALQAIDGELPSGR